MSLVERRAGGTDLTERRRSGVSTGPVHDIERHDALTAIEPTPAGGFGLGALVTIDAIASHPGLRAGYPALTAAASGLATPQIRRVATIGGNLLQHTRCWYYRHPGTDCLKKGGDSCPAREGNHRYGALFDLGPCVAVHPSTLGASLLAYDGLVQTDHRGPFPVGEVFGDGTDGRRDHRLGDETLTGVHLPPPAAGERGAYVRAISRTRAEWPLAEAVVRMVIEEGRIVLAAVAVGGVAPVPLRLPAVENALTGRAPTAAVLAEAGALATAGARPLPMTVYKGPLLVGAVVEALERASATYGM